MKKTILLLIVLYSIQSCGAFDGTYERDYSFAIITDEPEIELEIRRVFDRYNQLAGKQVLSYRNDDNRVGSYLVVREGITAQDGKIGYGNYVLTSDGTTFGTQEYDKGWVLKQIAESNGEISNNLLKLTTHEFGHNIGLSHCNDNSDSMAASISGTKNFSDHFRALQHWLGLDSPEDVRTSCAGDILNRS